MNKDNIQQDKTLLPGVELDEATVKSLLPKAEKEAQVIVHCFYNSFGESIRIWKTTFLNDNGSRHRSRLLLAENITFYPKWMPVARGKTARFTLVFSGLPKGCRSFDLVEDIPQPGGFLIRNIKRNGTDVYSLEIR